MNKISHLFESLFKLYVALHKPDILRIEIISIIANINENGHEKSFSISFDAVKPRWQMGFLRRRSSLLIQQSKSEVYLCSNSTHKDRSSFLSQNSWSFAWDYMNFNTAQILDLKKMLSGLRRNCDKHNSEIKHFIHIRFSSLPLNTHTRTQTNQITHSTWFPVCWNKVFWLDFVFLSVSAFCLAIELRDREKECVKENALSWDLKILNLFMWLKF